MWRRIHDALCARCTLLTAVRQTIQAAILVALDGTNVLRAAEESMLRLTLKVRPPVQGTVVLPDSVVELCAWGKSGTR